MRNCFSSGNVAVVTGAASGIGLAAATHFASLGMRVCLADRDESALQAASGRVVTGAKIQPEHLLAVPTDVSLLADVRRLKSTVDAAFGRVSVLMNNAAVGLKGGPWTDLAAWKTVLDVNLWGVIHGIQTFVPDMLEANVPAIVINVGSKQGITTPPGNAAYNVAKAGVKVVTEQLAHELRQVAGCRVGAHLLIPGFTFTGMTQGAGDHKPAGAWTAEQVVGHLMARLEANDFYILCPDNQTTEEDDRRRIQWAADDLIKGRPALSRWDPAYAQQFAEFMARPS